MGIWNELPYRSKFLILVGVAIAVTLGLYLLSFRALDEQNKHDAETLASKQAEVAQLRPYKGKLIELNRNIESLKQQLELQKRIVPDEKEAEGLIQLMQGAASSAGIEIRRYTAKPVASKEFYTEVPFEVEVDGPYYAMLQFFEKVASLERIVTVGEVRMAATTKPGPAKAKKIYAYAPGESVVSTCVATTFFSHDAPPPAAAAPVKK